MIGKPSRRDFLASSALFAAASIAGGGGLLNAAPALNDSAEDAFIWGLPLVLSGRYLKVAANAGVPFNQFSMNPNLATPATKALGAQVDTLYGAAWIDLGEGPQVIDVPDTADRYYSIQLMDMYQDAFAYIGRRATGTKAGSFVLTPPGYQGNIPSGFTEIKAPTSKILAFARTLVRSAADLPEARRIHGFYTLGSLSAYPSGRIKPQFREGAFDIIPVIDLSNAGLSFFEELNQLVRDYPPLPYDRTNFARFAPLGLRAGQAIPQDPALRDALVAAVPAGLAKVRAAASAQLGSWFVNGWRSKMNVPNIIEDPLRRAATSLYGPGTQVAEEAFYFSALKGPDGQPLSGAKRYRLHFPAGQLPPVDAFWSVGAYTKAMYLYDNVINRYSITDRTSGLRHEADGSLILAIQHDQPAEGSSNWLPVPAEDFMITIRTYQPRPEIVHRDYKLPPLEIV